MDSEPTDNHDVPLSQLDSKEKAKRAASFGDVAADYERFRPGPTPEALEWILPKPVGCAIDLGAGTGALTRQLIGRASRVIAVEPDENMRAILTTVVPEAHVVDGTGESMPIPDTSADAVLASSSWHWMDTAKTLSEVSRVLVPGGLLCAKWSGPDPEGAFLLQAQELLGTGSAPEKEADPGKASALAQLALDDGRRPISSLEIPSDAPFTRPTFKAFTRQIALTADDLIGFLGTISWVITQPENARIQLFDQARQMLRDFLGVEGDVTVDVDFKTTVWASYRHS
jgi:ubiquinone/menaquinone biosynthesis C-methylase UbiE